MESINDFMPQSNDWNNERMQTLKQLFPDWFTNEGSLNIDEIKKAVNPELVNETERYEFRWFGKSQAKRNAFTPSNATLVFDEDRSVNPDNSENLIIEGENLEVLKLLSGSYREKIKCIYIDPPYNTGGDFVYNDDFSKDKKSYWEESGVIEDGVKIDTNTEKDGRYHSNWLNLLYSRLLIARQLLKENGIIFISIDDNEVSNLKMILNEVFGEDNFLEQMVWKNKTGGGAATMGWIGLHEYILCYAKDKSKLSDISVPYSEKTSAMYSQKDEYFNVRGSFATWPLDTTSMGDRPNLKFPIYHDGVEIWPKQQWLWSKERVIEAQKQNMLVFNPQSDGSFKIRFKGYLKDENGIIRRGKPLSILDGPYTQEGSKDFENLFPKAVFPFPKPVRLLKDLFSIRTDENEDDDIILDFFGGSGSTGHAIFELNKNNANKKFILVQIPEATDENSAAYKEGYKKISDITIERNKRVVQNIIKEKESQQPDLFTGDKKEDALQGLGFKVFKLQKSNFPRVDFAPDAEKTEAENIELLKTYIANKELQLVNAFNKPELLTEILLKNGFNLNYKLGLQTQFASNEVQLASDGEKETLICLDVVINADTVDYFKTNTDKKFICLERALDTTKKYNLKHYLGDKFNAF